MPIFIARKLLTWVDAVEIEGIEEVRKCGGYHDEPLFGKRRGQHSIRLNKSYRAIYTKMKSEAKAFIEDISGGPLTFGEMIQSIRQADEISQAELARRMKISRAMLCAIEKGRRPVSVERAKRFAEELEYSVTQFVAMAVEDHLRKSGFKAKIHLEAA